MNIFALLSFFSSVIYLFTGIFVFIKNSKLNTNRIFNFLCFILSYYSLTYAFYFISENKNDVIFWFKMSSFAWCLLPASILHFIISLSKNNKFNLSLTSIIYMYLLGLIFIAKSMTGSFYASDFINLGYYWKVIPDTTNFWYWFYISYFLCFIIASFFLLWKWYYTAILNREKKQASLLLISTFFIFVLGILSNIISPYLGIKDIPEIAHLIGLVFIFIIAYSIIKYNLLGLTPNIAANEIIDNMSEFLFFIDNDNKIINCNTYTENILGYNKKDIIGKKFSSLFIEKEIVIEKLEIVKSGQVSKTDLNIIKKNNEHIPVNLTFTLIKDSFDDIIGSVIVGNETQYILQLQNEIEERMFIQNQLVNSRQKAEESDKLKSAFLANMSHEIRTPMNAILGFANLLNSPSINNEKKTDYINIINTSGKQLLNLINDIIDISKIEAGQIKIKYDECGLNKMLTELHTMFRTDLERKGKNDVHLFMHLSLPDSNDIIYSDSFRLQQVITNLIGNAVKFTDKGSIEFGYNVFENKVIQFYVKDTGIGISKEDKRIVFERFRQADYSMNRKYGGTGLGLTISKALVELLKGKIWLESEEDKGTTFYFELPYNPVNISELTVDITKEEANLYLEFDWRGKTILLVEDDKLSLKYLEEILRDTHINMIPVTDGKEAVRLCQANLEIDLILMDLQLPKLNGYDASIQIKLLNKSIPIIAQTANAMVEDLQKCFEAGCNDYITKPINREELLYKINKFLNK